MEKTIIEITPKNDEVNYFDFSKKMGEIGISEQFDISLITSPVHVFREEFLEYIAEHGLSSLFKFNISMEDITSPSMTVNQIEIMIAKFVGKLEGARKLIVIDPYFYAKSAKIDGCQLFLRLLRPISSDLKEICFITNGIKDDTKNDIHSGVKAINKSIKIQDLTTNAFHDRFWIDPDNKKGIVMGTSLNGLGNKISLVDRLCTNDVAEISKLAKKEGVSI